MELTHLYTHSSSIGYGRMGVELTAALERAGVDVYDGRGTGPDGETGFDLEEREKSYMRGIVDAPKERRVKTTNVSMWSAAPPHVQWWYEGQYTVMLTMYEAMSLPESFRENLHNFDLILVPSEQNRALFAPFHDNVQVLPLGIDGERWKYTKRQMPESHFNFLIGGSGPRKGTDLAHRAFEKVFANYEPSWGPEPRLIMKNPRSEPFGGPRVEVIGGRITNEAEVALYAEAHCYVQPSRGEGFGLQPLQAIAQGIPTILTDGHGHEGFAHLGIPIGWDPAPAGPFIYGDSGDWWEPRFDELCYAMWKVYSNYQVHEVQARWSAGDVRREWTWGHAAERLIEILGAEMEKPYSGDGSFVIPKSLEYPMVLVRDYKAEIGGTSYHFEKGVTYYVTADVKRVLFGADLVDVSALDSEVGLLPDQIEQVGGRRAIQRKCESCGQTPGESKDRGDELFEIAEAVAPYEDMVARLAERLDLEGVGSQLIAEARDLLHGKKAA